MLLLHKGGLNHLWKALKIINVLKSWDLSNLSIPDRKAKNPKSYIVNGEEFPCKPRWEYLKGKHGSKAQPLLFCSCSDHFPEKRRLVWPWCAYLHLSLTPTPLQLFLSPLAITVPMWQAPLKEQQHWELNCCQSWVKPPQSWKSATF